MGPPDFSPIPFPRKALWRYILGPVFKGLTVNDFRRLSIDPMDNKHHPANQKIAPNGMIRILRRPRFRFFLSDFISSLPPSELYNVYNNKIC